MTSQRTIKTSKGQKTADTTSMAPQYFLLKKSLDKLVRQYCLDKDISKAKLYTQLIKEKLL